MIGWVCHGKCICWILGVADILVESINWWKCVNQSRFWTIIICHSYKSLSYACIFKCCLMSGKACLMKPLLIKHSRTELNSALCRVIELELLNTHTCVKVTMSLPVLTAIYVLNVNRKKTHKYIWSVQMLLKWQHPNLPAVINVKQTTKKELNAENDKNFTGCHQPYLKQN